jgi:kynureninase
MTDSTHQRHYAVELDEKDPLKQFRSRFQLKDPRLIYLDGNSLGVLPVETPVHLDNVVSEEWGRGLIRSWNTGWYERSKQVSEKIARLIGAKPNEVIVADSTSVNLFKLAYAALKLKSNRKGIVTDELNFPTDIYIFQGLVDLFQNQSKLDIVKSDNGMGISLYDLENSINDDTALVSLSYVLFKSSFLYNMKMVTGRVHAKGAMVLWDLSHAVGAVPIDLNSCNVDFAVGCTYKYLNGGPGSPAFLYVREDLQDKIQSPVWGWFGQKNPFDFQLNYEPASGIDRFLAGTPPILSLSALNPSLDISLEAGMDALRKKSVLQSNYLIDLWRQYLAPQGYTLGSPTDENQRGSHVSLKHKEAYRICKALIDENTGKFTVIPDFREPDNIRLGITPLYTRFVDLFDAVMEMKDIVENRIYEKFSSQKDKVT